MGSTGVTWIVFGPAASGKTLVARGLSDDLGWPIFAKDTIKAALCPSCPWLMPTTPVGSVARPWKSPAGCGRRGDGRCRPLWRRDMVVTRCPASLEPWWRSSVNVIGRRWRRGATSWTLRRSPAPVPLASSAVPRGRKPRAALASTTGYEEPGDAGKPEQRGSCLSKMISPQTSVT